MKVLCALPVVIVLLLSSTQFSRSALAEAPPAGGAASPEVKDLSLNSNTDASLWLEEYPPRLYLTVGFWILVAAFVAGILVGLLLWRSRRPRPVVGRGQGLPNHAALLRAAEGR